MNRQEAEAAQKGTVTASSLNVRKGAGTSYAKLQEAGKSVTLKKGTSVTIESEKSGWYYVSFKYNNKTLKGYVSKQYVKVTASSSSSSNSGNTSTSKKTGKVTASRLNVRKGAGTNYAILTSGSTKVVLSKGTSVTINSEKSGWYNITFTFNKKSLTGYVSKEYISVTSNGSSNGSSNSGSSSSGTTTTNKISVPAVVNTSALNVRKSASASAAQLTVGGKKVKLSRNAKITISNDKIVSGDIWYYVSFTYGGKTQSGWVHGDYVKLTVSSPVKAKIRGTSQKILTSAGSTSYLKVSGAVVSLSKATDVTITQEVLKNNVRYYKISFTYKSKTYSGYVKATEVYFQATSSSSTPAATPQPTVKPTVKPTVQPTVKPTVKPTTTPKPTETPSEDFPILSDAEFEKMLTEQGFPENYKVYLRKLHKEHPTWRFEAMKTNIAWDTAISKQTTVKGKNTVQNKNYEWLSRLNTSTIKTFDFINDKPIATDGTTWFTTSEVAVRYYMDPRNFLDDTQIFQFEDLSYNSKYHTKAILQSMVKGTPLEGTFTYTADNGQQRTMYYVDAFMDAANYADVSPIHLVARVKQEVLVYRNGKYVFSDSASGNRAGYEGYYNFYNIGASDTSTGSAVENGLKYAMNGGKNATLNAKMFIPWDNPYKAIMGGAKFIGDSYIAKGQNTLYLQKFNVSTYQTHSHQYMTNVQASYSEAKKVYSAYNKLDLLDIPMVFKIPVFTNMPSKVSIHPSETDANYKKSFNNYLKNFVVKNVDNNTELISYTRKDSYKFNPEDTSQVYVINNVPTITIAPTVANSGATYTMTATYNGKTATLNANTNYSLEVGSTVIKATVKAANGDTRTYEITLTRQS